MTPDPSARGYDRSMRHRLLPLLLLLVTGCDRQNTPAGPSTAEVRVSGRAVDFETGTGVPGVTVAFGGTNTITDAGGSYALALPATGQYEPMLDGARAGSSRVSGSAYRGDFLVRTGTCVSRYGTVTDSRRLRPVAGATVSLGGHDVTSGADGWYRIDFGCPANGIIGFNTTFISVSRADYITKSQIVGRGIYLASRLDLELEQR
jgi:hypothetical protein